LTEKGQKREIVPEPETELETEPETEPTPDIPAEPATEAEPAAEPSHEGKWLSDLEAGETFFLGGEKYRLRQMFGETAQVMLLAIRKGQVAPKKFVDQEVGVEMIDMPGDTIIE